MNLAPPCQGYYADMMVSPQKENSKLNERNMENKLYLLEYEQRKGRMIDYLWKQEMGTSVKDKNLEGNSYYSRVQLNTFLIFLCKRLLPTVRVVG